MHSHQNGFGQGYASSSWSYEPAHHRIGKGSLIKQGRLLFKFGERAADSWQPADVRVTSTTFSITPTDTESSGYLEPILDAELRDLKVLPPSQVFVLYFLFAVCKPNNELL